MELESDTEDDYQKNEYDNSFGRELSLSGIESTNYEPGNNFPMPLNPHFDLQIALQVSFYIELDK